MPLGRLIFIFFLTLGALRAADITIPAELGPYVAPASDEAERTRAAFKLPAGMHAEIWAAQPLIGDPVAISFDRQGRLYVTEHHRNRHGVEDDREHRYWLEDDLAARTIEDRLAFMQKWAAAGKKPMKFFTEIPDRLVCLEDRDGDGRAEVSRTLALFADPLDGANVGVLARDGDVWVTCIPNLWHFRDDGRSERLAGERVFTGFGVKFSLHGHDLHGLVQGPDGRLYWSSGDRGYNVRTREGGVIADIWRGAVFRCEPDGSKLEVYCTGLRNPQELVFDDLGNLITVDNDNDAADEEPRVLHLVEGGDYGWHSGNLWPSERAVPFAPVFRRPWFEDGIWKDRFAEQPAWVMPPVSHLANGPCGLTRDPGVTLMPPAWRGSFFLTDWRGGKSSPVIRFNLEPRGNSFAMVGNEEFMNGILPTDVEFGPDGRLYVVDMVASVQAPGGGRRAGVGSIFALSADVPRETAAEVAQMREWFKAGTAQVSDAVLLARLAHPDYRVRLDAQLALAGRDGAREALQRLARATGDLRARVHALQALGQQQRRTGRGLGEVVSLLSDPEPEMRAQMARQLADTPIAETAPALTRLLNDAAPRAQYLGAMALGRCGDAKAIGALAEMLRANADRDVHLRLAGVMGFVRLGATPAGASAVAALARDASPAVRLGVLLAWRRMGEPRVADFLADAEARLVTEAVRAVHDLSVKKMLPRVAELSGRLASFDAGTARRVLDARYRLGRGEDAEALADVASASAVPSVMRCEALALLAEWAKPDPRNRVTGEWAPLAERSAEPAIAAAKRIVPMLLRNTPADVTAAAIGLATQYRLADAIEPVLALVRDAAQAVPARAAAAEALIFWADPRAIDVAQELLGSTVARLRIAGRNLLLARLPERGVPEMAAVLREGELAERKAAAVALGLSPDRRAFDLLAAQVPALTAGTLPPEAALDVLEGLDAAVGLGGIPKQEENRRRNQREKRANEWLAQFPAADPLRNFRSALVGGDAARGRELFHQKVELQCVRCHKIEGQGTSTVGPDLTGIGAKRPREYLLRAVVEPNADLAPGFDYTTLTLTDGRVLSGLVQKETADELRLAPPTEGAAPVNVKKSAIRQRVAASPMPPLVSLMTPRELRDIIEFLATNTNY